MQCNALRREGAEKGYFIRSDATNMFMKPGFFRWWNTAPVVALDLTNPEAVAWFVHRLRTLQAATGIDGFKFDAGARGAPFCSPPLEILNLVDSVFPALLSPAKPSEKPPSRKGASCVLRCALCNCCAQIAGDDEGGAVSRRGAVLPAAAVPHAQADRKPHGVHAAVGVRGGRPVPGRRLRGGASCIQIMI